MGQYYLKLPKMGESVVEATITKWLKNNGDSVSLDEPVVEIATDKVDTDVTSEVEGIILEQKFNVNDVVQIGEVLAIIETDSEEKAKSAKTAMLFSRANTLLSFPMLLSMVAAQNLY